MVLAFQNMETFFISQILLTKLLKMAEGMPEFLSTPIKITSGMALN